MPSYDLLIWKFANHHGPLFLVETPFTRVGEICLGLDTLSHDVQHRHYPPLSNRVGTAPWRPVRLCPARNQEARACQVVCRYKPDKSSGPPSVSTSPSQHLFNRARLDHSYGPFYCPPLP